MIEQEQTRRRTFTWEDPVETATHIRKLDGLAALQAIQAGELPPPPVASLLNMEIKEVSAGRVVFALQPAEFHYNPLGNVHGGVTATLLDTVMACAIHSQLPAGQGYTTLEIKVNYLRALTVESGLVYGEGKVIHLGGRVATAEGRVVDENGKIYAHATTTCLILRPEHSA
jgi:uncharacterized protein (TIGR00369 family)